MTTKIKKKLRPPVKTHGGKYYLADFIISYFPENYKELNYCEPMCAGASVFLNKEPSPHEVINDIDKGLVYVFKALRDEPNEFIERLKRIRYTERAFKMALNKAEEGFEDYIDHAVNEYMLRRMSRGGMKKAFAWSERLRGGQPGDVNAWETMLEELPRIAERVKNTTILNESVLGIIKIWDAEDTLMYLDPPYLPDTRSEGSTEVYEHEMTVEDHISLLSQAKACRGKVIISGYSSSLYNRTLKGWKVKKKNVANHSGQGKQKERRVESIWFNY
jgi:DNA adenine methylase